MEESGGPPPSDAFLRLIQGTTFMGRGEEKTEEEQALLLAVNGAERLGRLNHRRLDAMNALADYYTQQGRLREAEPLWMKTLSLEEKIFGPEHQKLAAPMGALSYLYERMGRYAEAEAVHLLALKIHERNAVENSGWVAEDLMRAAQLSARRGRAEAGEISAKRSLTIARIIHGDESLAMARFQLAVGDFYRTVGRFDLAHASLLKAGRIFQRERGDRHPESIEAWIQGGHLEKSQHRFREADTLYRRAMAAHIRTEGKRALSVGTDLLHVGDLSRAEGKPKAAFKMLRASLEIREAGLGPGHPDVAETEEVLAEVQVLLRRFELAETGFLRAWDIYEKTLGSDAPGLLRTQAGLAALYFDRGCYEEADRLLAQLTHSHERIFGPDHTTVRAALTNQLVSYEAQDRWDEANGIRQRLAGLSGGKTRMEGIHVHPR